MTILIETIAKMLKRQQKKGYPYAKSFLCDPEKQKGCPKTECYKKCFLTTDVRCAVLCGNGLPIELAIESEADDIKKLIETLQSVQV